MPAIKLTHDFKLDRPVILVTGIFLTKPQVDAIDGVAHSEYRGSSGWRIYPARSCDKELVTQTVEKALGVFRS
ncbi:MAG: hypothetical protein WCZ87_00220 [Thiohalobacteraceae bacterium]